MVRWRVWGAIGVLLLSAGARGEITVSLNIQGSPDEIMGVLRHLQLMGIGGGAAGAENPLKLNVHSTASAPGAAGLATVAGATASAAAPAAPVAPPQPALRNPAVSPASTPPGAPVLLTIVVADLEHKVDTVAAWIKDTSITVDLRDNGQNGDAVLGDGTWSATLTVPKSLPEGNYTVVLTAYDAKGTPVSVPGDGGAPKPLSVNASFAVGH